MNTYKLTITDPDRSYRGTSYQWANSKDEAEQQAVKNSPSYIPKSSKYNAELNDPEIDLLMLKFAEVKNLNENTEPGNHFFSNEKYFVYVANFPKPHLAIDNASSTTRLHSIDTWEALNKLL